MSIQGSFNDASRDVARIGGVKGATKAMEANTEAIKAGYEAQMTGLRAHLKEQQLKGTYNGSTGDLEGFTNTAMDADEPALYPAGTTKKKAKEMELNYWDAVRDTSPNDPRLTPKILKQLEKQDEDLKYKQMMEMYAGIGEDDLDGFDGPESHMEEVSEQVNPAQEALAKADDVVEFKGNTQKQLVQDRKMQLQDEAGYKLYRDEKLNDYQNRLLQQYGKNEVKEQEAEHDKQTYKEHLEFEKNRKVEDEDEHAHTKEVLSKIAKGYIAKESRNNRMYDTASVSRMKYKAVQMRAKFLYYGKNDTDAWDEIKKALPGDSLKQEGKYTPTGLYNLYKGYLYANKDSKWFTAGEKDYGKAMKKFGEQAKKDLK